MLLLIQLISSYLLLLQIVGAVPTGFVDEGVTSVTAITGAFAPNPLQNGKPMLLLSSKTGLIHVVPDPDNSDSAILIANFTDKVCVNGERGLQTILPHPDFKNNPYIYMYYTRYIINCPEDAVTGPSNILSRFTMNTNTLQIDVRSEVQLLETPPAYRFFHNGGSMRIGNDGFLYITTGDGGNREDFWSQQLNILYGKVLRLDLNGNAPPSNPYTKANGDTGVPCRFSKGRPPIGSPKNAKCEEIFAYGLRNPFRMAMDPNTKDKVRFVIGDVGAADWEEINEGGTDYMGTNYMWPIYEGPCERKAVQECNRRNASGPGITEPFYYYDHQSPDSDVRSAAVTGSAFVPTGLWPPRYKYLFIDYIFGRMYNLISDPSVACPTCIPPKPAYRNETFLKMDRVVDMFFGPYKGSQALYVVSRGEGQNIRRIRYTGLNNAAPISVIAVNKTKTIRNRVLAFKGSGSSDPDGDKISYLWDFGDGETSTLVNPFKSYSKFGEYEVTLTVTDSLGQTDQSFVTIVIGTRPKATIESPARGTEFAVGDILRLKGSATDGGGRIIPSNQIYWEVRQHHATHFHPFLDQEFGNDFDLFPAPEPEDLPSTTNSYLNVSMTAVDRNGVTRTVFRVIQPKKVLLDIESEPTGLTVLVNDIEFDTPQTITVWENQILRLEVTRQGVYGFDRWSMGGNRKTTYTVPPSTGVNQNIVAIFKQL